MTPSQALLLGIPAGAAFSMLSPSWWLLAGSLLFLLSPKPRWQWRWTIVTGLMIGCLRVHLIPTSPPITPGIMTVAGNVTDVRETWTKVRYTLSNATRTDEVSLDDLGTISATVRGSYAAAEPGAHLVLNGTLNTPMPYLAAHGVKAVLDDARVVKTGTGNHSLLSQLSRLRRQSERSLETLLPLPESALLSGLLLGTDERLPEKTADHFRAAGLSHLTAVSGSNVALILSLMGKPLAWLPARWRFWPLALGIGLFTVLVGAPASAVRAALTGIVGLIALQSGRSGAGRSTLIVVLAGMTLWEPQQLTADAGFQLSFLATWGIIQLGPPLRRLLEGRLPAFCAEAIAVTLAAELPTLPWSAWLFGNLAIIAPFTNILAAPLAGLATLSGLALVVTALLCPPAVLIVRPINWLCLHSLIILAETGTKIGMYLPDPGPPPTLALMIYLGALAALATILERLTVDRTTPSAVLATSPQIAARTESNPEQGTPLIPPALRPVTPPGASAPMSPIIPA